ncbi:GntR family transcriptional regulator [Shimia biformata]|uniref:GntR family transcriptional regulator n=1 Tax=Shimia biformata TaxID=1294299 RepID=UPI0019528D9F|nr:GntR family transcriptional regulator [Shimia biformata]
MAISRLDDGKPINTQLIVLLRNRIVQGELLPGAKLSEAKIAADLGVSRQPVREAFIKLADEGLLEIRPQRATVVPKISVPRVMEVRFVREAIEADIVRLAATRFGRAEHGELARIIAAQEGADSVEEFIAEDDRLHRFLAEGVGQGYAWGVVESLKLQLDRVRFLTVRQFPKQSILDHHRAIVAGVVAGNPDRAEQAMRAHLNAINDDLPEIAKSMPELFEDHVGAGGQPDLA